MLEVTMDLGIETFTDRLGFNFIKAVVTGRSNGIYNQVIDGQSS